MKIIELQDGEASLLRELIIKDRRKTQTLASRSTDEARGIWLKRLRELDQLLKVL